MKSHAAVEGKERIQTAAAEHFSPATVEPPVLTIHRKKLFEDSLLETPGRQRRKRAWTTLLSLTLQCFVVGILLLVPLLYTEVLPKHELVTLLVAPPPPPPPPPPAARPATVRVVKATSDIVNGRLMTPSRIPKKVLMIKEAEAPPPLINGVVGGVPGGIPGGQLGGVIGGIVGSLSRLPAVPKLYKLPTPQLVRVSQGVTQGLLIHRIQLSYPPLAREARIQGAVVLAAIIGKDGTVQNLRLERGRPMLTAAAINAVKQWRYKPYLLNGRPVEVETTITVNFTLGGDMS